MSSPTNEADFGFWSVTIPKNSEKKLEMENESSVYHVSNATLGNEVSGGRTTLWFKSKGKKAPICNLVNNTLENASLDLIVSQSMNASFVTKGPNAITVSGYVQPLVDENSDNDSGVVDLPVTNGADGAVTVKSSAAKKVKSPETKAPVELKTKDQVKPKAGAKDEAEPETKKAAEPKPKKEDEPKKAPTELKESLKRKLEEAEATDAAKAAEKKRNKKKRKKKKKNRKDSEDASVSTTNGAAEPMDTDKAPEKKPEVVKQKSNKAKDVAESSKMEVEEAAKEVAKEPKETTTKKSAMKAAVKESPVKKAEKDSSPKSKSKKSKKMVDAGKGVKYRVLKKGKAGVKPAKKGDSITLLYVGCLKDGTQFDKNLKDGLTFKIGGDEVIPGIELGVMGMCPKEKRRIIIPAEQGYGEDGASEGKIPPNAELQFTVQRK